MAPLLIDSPADLIDRAKEGLMLSPGWARIGLTFGDRKMRDAALDELATSIARRIANASCEMDPNQLPLL